MNAREGGWRVVGVAGATVGYGCLAAFLGLIGSQIYRWFKDGEWVHISLADAMRAVLSLGRGAAAGAGRLADLAHWLDAPVDWLGLHKVVELLPASLALFMVAILGNFFFVYASDRLRERRPRPS